MKVKVCVVQDCPVFFDKDRTIKKLEAITKEQAANGCQLIVFPETFIPGYPRGFSFDTKVGSRSESGRELYAKYHENSIDLESTDRTSLESIARDHNIFMVIGVTEKNSQSGSLYCSMLYLSPIAGLLGAHRKIKPTGSERIIWAEADGESLITCQTSLGKIGGLICWENYMPLARMAIYQQGVEIYVAPTADSRDSWTATMQHIALEGRCFVLGSNQYFTKSMYPAEYQSLAENESEHFCRGGSIIVAPNGTIIAGPLLDQSGVLIAELDLTDIIKNKLDFDVNGHYSRKDIFEFKVNGQPDVIME